MKASTSQALHLCNKIRNQPSLFLVPSICSLLYLCPRHPLLHLLPYEESYHPCAQTKPNRKTSFGDRCLLMAKQQRTRLYILRRCVSMLLCWHDHSD
ncbi:PREDICTED: uncharacterized protein LOC104745518 [Camelina sativa]|uniref:Uncharacterized protein LOC104745518 n=1 Tax=Camelina sativa TaxID=90675 RepID=A0ABM1QZM7_CAMSA|nr:PREDICTED: uncharacterized protein LOC104745518 [Camelina sativa]